MSASLTSVPSPVPRALKELPSSVTEAPLTLDGTGGSFRDNHQPRRPAHFLSTSGAFPAELHTESPQQSPSAQRPTESPPPGSSRPSSGTFVRSKVPF